MFLSLEYVLMLDEAILFDIDVTVRQRNLEGKRKKLDNTFS